MQYFYILMFASIIGCVLHMPAANALCGACLGTMIVNALVDCLICDKLHTNTFIAWHTMPAWCQHHMLLLLVEQPAIVHTISLDMQHILPFMLVFNKQHYNGLLHAPFGVDDGCRCCLASPVTVMA